MTKPPKHRIKFNILNPRTKEEITRTLEGQYIDDIKTELYKEFDHRQYIIEMEFSEV